MARTIAKDHDAKRAHILRGAAKVFATEGYDRASMARIALACDISKAAIYHYYPGKEALLFDILDSYLERLRDRVCGIDLSGLPPDRRLHRITTEILLAYQGMDHEHQLQTGAMAVLPEHQQRVLRTYQRDLVARLSEVLVAIESDLGADARRLRATTMSVFGMLNWFYMWNRNADEAARRDYAALVADLTIGGVRVPPYAS